MSPQAVLDRLYAYTDFARRRTASYTAKHYHLDGMRALLAALGNPEARLRIVHVAGTKGKGSTCHYLARLLTESGEKTGLYTSPQVFDERDRIRVGGRPLSWAEFTRLFEACERAARRAKLRPTVFEFFTAMALVHFKACGVSFAVMETGLGGRLDSTNVLSPELCLITPIDFDHMDKLGDTLDAIASEKAGIIKRGIPVLTSPQRPAAARVIRQKAERERAPLTIVSENDAGLLPPALPSPRYQDGNRALALAAFRRLGGELGPRAAHRVLSSPVAGRYQRLGRYLLDGAHNPFAVERLVDSVKRDPHLRGRRVAVVFFCLSDKPLKKMLGLFPRTWARHYFDLDLAWAPGNRAANLAALGGGKGRPPVLADWKAVEAVSRVHDITLLTGSFSLVSHALRELQWPLV
ncbi:MAG: hypothetical protein J0L75_08735 [Spirochaetes bacterium]|nr:hypothetical protein [Spirochaetota bacterium]